MYAFHPQQHDQRNEFAGGASDVLAYLRAQG